MPDCNALLVLVQANVVIESFQAVTGNPTRTVDLPGGPPSSSASAQGLAMPPPATPALAAAPYSGRPPQMPYAHYPTLWPRAEQHSLQRWRMSLSTISTWACGCGIIS